MPVRPVQGRMGVRSRPRRRSFGVDPEGARAFLEWASRNPRPRGLEGEPRDLSRMPQAARRWLDNQVYKGYGDEGELNEPDADRLEDEARAQVNVHGGVSMRRAEDVEMDVGYEEIMRYQDRLLGAVDAPKAGGDELLLDLEREALERERATEDYVELWSDKLGQVLDLQRDIVASEEAWREAERDASVGDPEWDGFPAKGEGTDPLMLEALSPEAKRLFGGQGGFVPPPPVSPSPSLLGGTNFAMSGGEGQLFDPGQRQPIPESKRRYGVEELRRIRAGEPPQTPVPPEEDEGESRAEPPLDAVPATEEEEALIAEEEGRTGDETLDESTFSAMRSLQTVPQGFQPVTGDLGSGGLSLRDAALIATAIAGLGLTGGGSGIVGGALKAAPAVGRAAAAGGTGLLALLGLAGPASAETPADASPAGAAVRALRDHRRGRNGRVGR